MKDYKQTLAENNENQETNKHILMGMEILIIYVQKIVILNCL